MKVKPGLYPAILLLSALSACIGGRERPATRSLHEAVGAPGVALGSTSSLAPLRMASEGVRVQGGGDAVTLGDRWAVGSLTKAMTSALAGTLVDQGKLRWTDRIRDVLPQLRGSLPAYGEVTLEQLLAHRGGILDDSGLEPRLKDLPAFEGDIRARRLQAAEWLLRQEPCEAPGTRFRYSNAGYLVAAAMIEEAAGEPWEDALFSRLLTPLGIQAALGLPCEEGPGQPRGHTRKPEGWVPGDRPAEPDGRIHDLFAPAGTKVSMTLESALAWARVHLKGLRGQDAPVLKAGTVKKLHTPLGDGVALGWIASNCHGRAVSWHNGAFEGFSSCLVLDPVRDRAVVVFANGFEGDLVDPGGRLEKIAGAELHRISKDPRRPGRGKPGRPSPFREPGAD